MKKNTITKMIAVSAVLAITMVSLGGCDDTSAASSKSVSSEQAVSAADDVSVSFDETDTSSDTAFDDSIYDYYHHEDFDYYELSEIDGHIIDCGGNAGASDCFIVTDDYKVYHNQYIGGVEYFCTLNGEYESLVPLGGVRENCLITLNKDGSYTAYYADGENGYSVDFKIDNMVSYSAGNNSLSVYTLDDGVVNCTNILKDGTVETDHEKVNFDGASNSGYKWYSVFYTWDCFVDNDGKLFYLSGGNVLDMYGGENVDKFLGGEAPTSGFYCTQTGDSANVYYQEASEEYDKYGERHAVAMPEGYSVDDIKSFYCRTSKEVFIVTSDDCIWKCGNATADGAVFEKDERLSELNQGGNIKAMSVYDRSGIAFVGTNNKLYTFN